MINKFWEDMTPEEQAEILAQEEARDAWKDYLNSYADFLDTDTEQLRQAAKDWLETREDRSNQ